MRKEKADALVIGTGVAGCAAAAYMAEHGKKVIICDKNLGPGGASNTVIVVRCIRDDDDFREKAFKVHMQMTNWLGNAELVRNWIEKDSHMVEWLDKYGIEYNINYVTTLENLGETDDPLGGYPKGHLIAERAVLKGKGNGHGGALIVQKLLKVIEEKGGIFYRRTPAVQLLKDNDHITGAVIKPHGEEEIMVEADTVFLCTAGFNTDADMIKKYSGFDYTLDTGGTCTEGDFFFVWNAPKLDGSGIKMAWEIGAKRGPIGIAPFAHMPGPGIIGKVPWNMKSQLRIVQEQPYLWVNQNGKRFMDESIITDHFTSGRVVANQPGHYAYLIFDEATKRRMEEVGLDYTYFIFPSNHLTNLDEDINNVIKQGNKHIFIEDSIEKVCEKTGMPFDVLKETIEKYNADCEKKHDSQFGKMEKFLRPVKEGRIYCFRVYTSAYQTIGGLHVDGNARVMDNSDKPIKGLYAAGDIIAAEIFGEPPICGIGNAGIAISTALIAAEDAAAYLERK